MGRDRENRCSPRAGDYGHTATMATQQPGQQSDQTTQRADELTAQVISKPVVPRMVSQFLQFSEARSALPAEVPGGCASRLKSAGERSGKPNLNWHSICEGCAEKEMFVEFSDCGNSRERRVRHGEASRFPLELVSMIQESV